MGMQVRIKKGKNIVTETNKTQEASSYKTSSGTVSNSDYDMIKSCRTSIKMKALTTKSAAIIIVGKLRHIYFTTCQKHDDRFDIESFVYMDKVLFDILVDVIEGVIIFGEKGVTKEIVKETIRNAVELVEYETDINAMYEVVDKVYEVFG